MSVVYEIRMPEFEFYQRGEPSGHYARGIAINSDMSSIQLELLCNGHKVWIPTSKLKFISDNNHTMGRGYCYPKLRTDSMDDNKKESVECLN